MMIWYDHYGASGWGWLAMSVTMLLFLALIVVVAVLLVRALPRSDHGRREHPAAATGSAPEQILAERYARGEIDDEEYQRRLAILRGSPPGGSPPWGDKG